MTGSRYISLLGLMAALLLVGCPGRGGKPIQNDAMNSIVRYEYSGIRIVHQNSSHPVVHFRLLIEGGASETDAGFAGIAGLAMETALKGGAGDWNGMEFAAKLEAEGAQIGHFVTPDYSAMTLECLPDRVPAAWKVFMKAIQNPVFDAEAFDRIKRGRLAELRTGEGQPGVLAGRMAREAAFGEMPYGVAPEGTENSIESLERRDVRDYFKLEMMRKCKMILVVAGPITAEQLSDLLFDTLDMLPQGDCDQKIREQGPPVVRRVLAQHRIVPKQYMVGTLPGPSSDDKASLAMEFVLRILQHRLKQRLEKEEQLSYRPEVRFLRHRQGYGLVRFSSHRALMCAELVMSELRSLRKGIPEDEIETIRQQFVTELTLENETAAGIAQALGQCAVLENWETFGQRPEMIAGLEKKRLDQVVQKYLTGISWSYVGDTTRMDRKTLERF